MAEAFERPEESRRERLRLFVALPLPDRVRTRLATVRRDCASLAQRFRWTRPEGMHVTVVFIGERPAEEVPLVEEVLRRVAGPYAALRLAVKGLGCFPGAARPRVLWAGLSGDVALLGRLQRRMTMELTAAGIPLTPQPFKPHVTLGRASGPLDGPARRELEAHLQRPAPTFGSWTAGALELMRSQLQRGGSVYTTLSRVPLGRAAPLPGEGEEDRGHG
ncbi:MAG TPA: RNA 2',3'-cyclic phosphodiesterase [Chloroflexota bacterium]|nr:RNA 2',3'-cyclic phosphodiesterase [Chloroflexota bacterium]